MFLAASRLPSITGMSMKSEATIEDLHHVPEDGKAEIVNGEPIFQEYFGEAKGRMRSQPRPSGV